MKRLVVIALIAIALSACSNGPGPGQCANDCTEGALSCAGGVLSTCQKVGGCIEFKQTSTCPSGQCQDETTCATAPNCGSFTTCDTCAAPAVINCFWCPTTNACVLTPDQNCPAAITGPNSAVLCQEATACAPCTLTSGTLCADTSFQCTCGASQKPTDKTCAADTATQYCCSS